MWLLVSPQSQIPVFNMDIYWLVAVLSANHMLGLAILPNMDFDKAISW